MSKRPVAAGPFFMAIGLVGSLVSAPASASVQTVTVLDFAGPGGTAFTSLVAQSLTELYDMIDSDAYRSTAVKMSRTGASPEDVAAVATEERIDALVVGAITPGRPTLLRIVVRDGGDGSVAARLKYRVRRSGLVGAQQLEKITADLVRAFENVKGVHRNKSALVAEAPEVEEEAPSPEEPRATPTPADAESEDDPAGATDGTLSVTKRGPRLVLAGVELGAGFGFLVRTLDLKSNAATPYQGGAVATLRFDGSVFPFGWTQSMRARHPVLSTFGVSISWVEALPFKSLTPSNDLVSGNARRWSLALVSRIRTGSSNRPVITIATGGGAIEYSSADPVGLDVPNVSYSFLSLGLSIDIPLGTPRVLLGLGGTALVLVDAGPISLVPEYGGGGGFGGDVGAMLTVRPAKWLWLRAGIRYTGVSLSFDGTGAKSSPGALDTLFDGAIEVGFAG